MKPSSFQTTIENQFDYICKRAMEDERKNYMLYLSRIAKREAIILLASLRQQITIQLTFRFLHSMGYQ